MALAFGKRICESLERNPPLPVYIRVGTSHVYGIQAVFKKVFGPLDKQPKIEIVKQALDYCKLPLEKRIDEIKSDIKKIKEKLSH